MHCNEKYYYTLFEQIRAETGMNRREFAKALDMTKTCYEKMIRGQVYWHKRRLLKAFDLSGWSAEKFLEMLRREANS